MQQGIADALNIGERTQEQANTCLEKPLNITLAAGDSSQGWAFARWGKRAHTQDGYGESARQKGHVQGGKSVGLVVWGNGGQRKDDVKPPRSRGLKAEQLLTSRESGMRG